MSKSLARDQYSQFVLLFAFLAMATEIGGVAFLQSMARFAAEHRKERSRHGSIILTALVGGIGAGAIIVMLTLFLLQINLVPSAIKYSIHAILIYLVAMVSTSSINAVFNGLGLYRAYLVSLLTNSLSLLVLTVFVESRYGLNLCNIPYVYAFSVILQILFQLLFLARKKASVIEFKSYRYIFTFGTWYLLWSIFSIVESKIDVFIIDASGFKNDVAAYDVSLRFLQIIQMVATTISTVGLPRLLAAGKDPLDLGRARAWIQKKAWLAALLNVALVPVVIYFVYIYYDGRYNEIFYLYPLHAIAILFFLANLPLTAEIYRIGAVRYFFFASILVAVVKLPLSYLLTGLFGIVGTALSFIASQIVAFVFFYITTRRLWRRQERMA
jgi:O-antigen/teichoic acid export membrane protein